MKELSLQRLKKNTGEQLTTLYGCENLKLPKGEKVLERKGFSPDNSSPSMAAGWNGQKIRTNKRMIKVVSDYMNGDCTVTEL